MAKTSSARPRRTAGSHQSTSADSEVRETKELETSAVAVDSAADAVEEPTRKAEEPAEQSGNGQPTVSEDVANFDAETNAKYEQVKGGKLYIKDLQTMDVHKLHEIAKEEGIADYIGLKKQDLIFQILRARIRQNGLMYGEGVLESFPTGSDSSAARNTTICPARMTSTSAPARFADLAFAMATSFRGRFARPRNRSGILLFCALRPSTAKTPSESPTPVISRTSHPCIPTAAWSWSTIPRT